MVNKDEETFVYTAKKPERLERMISSSTSVAVTTFLTTAVVMTAYESLKQQIFGNLTLWQSHVITIVFTSVLSTLIAWWVSKELSAHFNQTRPIKERVATYDAAMLATSHYVGNAFNLFQLVRMEVDSTGTVSHETLGLIEKELSITRDSLKDISTMDNPTIEKIKEFLLNP